MKTACIFAILLAASVARADIEFAVPDDGRITLGVFDGAGRLVRTLHKLSRQEDFGIGLNGLVTNWDGKNDAGQPLPAGHYHVRGYLVGNDVRVSGEDFLFNDFAADAGFPGFSRIRDFSLLENGDLLLLAVAPPPNPPLLARVSEERGFVWSADVRREAGPLLGGIPKSFRQTDSAGHPLGGSVIVPAVPVAPPYFLPKLAVNSAFAFLLTQEKTGVYSLEDGREVFSAPSGGGTAALALAANDSEVFVSSPGGLTTILLARTNGRDAHSPWDLGGGLAAQLQESVTKTPAAFTSLDADASTLIGAAPEGVWVRKGSFAKGELPAAVRSVALGMPGTFWFVGVEADAPFVGQATFAGKILRALRPAAEDPKPEKIRASRTAEKFAVIESLPGLQRLRVMARSASGEWTIEWERTIRDSANFGFVQGKPSADAGDGPKENDIRFRLKENPLTGQRDFLTIRAAFDKSGSRLVSPDGLPLVEVSARPEVRRTAIHRGDSAASLRLLQGNGIFVEEFSITGLDDIFPLDAGGVELP
ncbi:MAG: hypothetical protein WCQ16_02160 [Verrucomicrobiae bacterium]